MASAGVEPWMGSSTDEHLPQSTIRNTLIKKQQSPKQYQRMQQARHKRTYCFTAQVLLLLRESNVHFPESKYGPFAARVRGHE